LLVVADATTLQRSLGLVLEAIEHGLPTILVLTMIDEVKARGGRLDPMALSRELGIHVLGVVGHRGVGLEPLRKFLEDPASWPGASRKEPLDLGIADERYARVDALCAAASAADLEPDRRSDRIDRLLLHPWLGLGVFGLVMVLLFQSIFAWAVPAMDLIDEGFGALAEASRAVLPEGLLADLVADGIIAGVGGVVIFLPQIVILFTFLHLLQDVGYMARAAFVIDRLMGWAGCSRALPVPFRG
jgi:ferrous iron transport protein B